MKRPNAFLLTIATTLALVACNSNLNPPTAAQPIILRPEDFVGGEASLTLDKLAPDESVAVIPVFATQDYQPDGFEFSIRTEHIKPQSAGPSARPQNQEEDPYHSNHIEVLEESKTIVEDLRSRGVKPLSVRSQAFDKCPAPYTPGKQCRFWVRTSGEMEQISATLQRVSEHALWFVQNQDLSELSATDLDPLVSAFEDTTIPTNTRHFGNPPDVDKNGKVIIVFSSALPKLLGYVYATDFFPDGTYSSARSNEGDILYVTTPKSVSDRIDREDYFRFVMPPTLTHELKHLISLGYKAQHALPWEESWLEEPSAMAAEELAKQGSQHNELQRYVKPALAAPHDFRLTHKERPSQKAEISSMYGYNMLFLWHIAEQMGHQEFWPAFLRSSKPGVANLEALTGKSLVDLMLDWSLTLLFDNTRILPDYEYQGLNLRDGTFEPLGYQSLDNLKGKVRSMAYYLGQGQGTDSTITVQTNYDKPYVIVVRFKGKLPW